MTIGVVLMTYGAPTDASDVAAYLTRVRDGTPSPELVREMRRRYERIGGSPLVAITQDQALRLEAELDPGYRVRAGMRFSDPTIDAAVTELTALGCARIVGLCLSPQWSAHLMGGYERSLRRATAARAPHAAVAMVGAWHRARPFVELLATYLNRALAGLPADVPILMTAHSLPRRVVETEREYIVQLRETAALVAAQAGLGAERATWAYQSAGHTAEEWLRPDLKELFPDLAAGGHRDVLIVPVQFLSDHLEVLYDLDVAARYEAETCGLRYHRTPMPNADPAFIKALAVIARSVG
jgi:ferrochelatase